MSTAQMDPHVGASDGGSGAGGQLALGKVLAEDGVVPLEGRGRAQEDSALRWVLRWASGGQVGASPDG